MIPELSIPVVMLMGSSDHTLENLPPRFNLSDRSRGRLLKLEATDYLKCFFQMRLVEYNMIILFIYFLPIEEYNSETGIFFSFLFLLFPHAKNNTRHIAAAQ